MKKGSFHERLLGRRRKTLWRSKESSSHSYISDTLGIGCLSTLLIFLFHCTNIFFGGIAT